MYIKYLLLHAPVMSLYLFARQEFGHLGDSMYGRHPDTFAIVFNISSDKISETNKKNNKL